MDNRKILRNALDRISSDVDSTTMAYELGVLESAVRIYLEWTDTEDRPSYPGRGAQRITERNELVNLTTSLGLSDWHEPDEQNITATVHGNQFDNAGFWGRPDHAFREHEELHVIIHRTRWDEATQSDVIEHPIAMVNLATLLAWASRPTDSDG